jgi:bacterioferritin-associated ferredoxin
VASVLKIFRRGGGQDLPGAVLPRDAGETQAGFVCHCLRVPYATVETAIDKGARSIADLQRSTSACTRCFGCRFELEGLLRQRLGDAFHHEATVSVPKDYGRTRVPQPMYMPVLAGYGGYEIDTRLIVFNWEGAQEPAGFRLDLMRPNGERVSASRHEAPSGGSTVIDMSRAAVADVLPEGIGLAKIVLDRTEVGSLRPYFHLATPTSVTTTHEKKGPKDPRRHGLRPYHWTFPIGRSHRPEEVYFWFVNTQLEPMRGQHLVWQSVDGETVAVPLPAIEFEQSVLVPLHEHVDSVAAGAKAGSVRLDPATFKVAGHMLRHDPEAQLWRVQHL